MTKNLPTCCERCPLYQEAGLFCTTLSLSELHDLSNESGPTTLRRGKSLDLEEFQGFPVIAVGAGALSFHGIPRDGGKVITTVFTRGSIFDLRKCPELSGGCLTALSYVEFCILAPTVFDKIISTNKEAREYLQEHRGVPLSLATDAPDEPPGHFVLHKIASLILECHRRQVTAFSNGKVVMPVPPNRLAEYLGLQTELVDYVISELEYRKIIETKDVSSKDFVIRKLAFLRLIANSDPPSRRCLSEPDSKVHATSQYLARRRGSNLTLDMKAQAVELSADASQSLARRRQRPSQANVRSTTHLRGRTSNPLAVWTA